MNANRNDPCPCGWKYKKCCMDADAQRQRAPFSLNAGFSSVPPTFSTDLDDLSNSVIDLIDSGELGAAEAACRQLQMQYPDQVDGIWRLAMVCEARGDHASAAKYYRQAAVFMQTNDNPHFPALRSDPMALSGASHSKQIPSSRSIVCVLFGLQADPHTTIIA